MPFHQKFKFSTPNSQASLAHKANHSFEPNGKFTLFKHPRFGPVPVIVTTREVVIIH